MNDQSQQLQDTLREVAVKLSQVQRMLLAQQPEAAREILADARMNVARAEELVEGEKSCTS